MIPMKLIQPQPGSFSLRLEAGATPVDGLIAQLGHEPNGSFWEGIAQLLVSTRQPRLEGRFDYDPEAGMFCAHGTDRAALEELATLLRDVIADPDGLRRLISDAEADGFVFDD